MADEQYTDLNFDSMDKGQYENGDRRNYESLRSGDITSFHNNKGETEEQSYSTIKDDDQIYIEVTDLPSKTIKPEHATSQHASCVPTWGKTVIVAVVSALVAAALTVVIILMVVGPNDQTDISGQESSTATPGNQDQSAHQTPTQSLMTAGTTDIMSLTTEGISVPTIAIIGGTWNSTFSSRVDLFSIIDGEVVYKQRGADLPFPYCCGATAVRGNEVYVIGGQYKQGTTYAIRYNALIDTWETLPSLTARCCEPSVSILGDRLYVAGGTWSSTVVQYLDLEDVSAGWQSEETHLPELNWQLGSVAVNNKIYISGGYAGGLSNTVRAPTLIEWSIGSTEWTYLADMSISRSDHCMVSDGKDRIWVVGWCHPCNNPPVEQYTISTNTWRTITDSPKEVNFRLCTYWDQYIIIKSSEDSEENGLFHLYNVEKDAWTSSTTVPMHNPGRPMIALISTN